ncbi:DUF3450 family protein [Cerasicoccus frondis]|uniref:DUF3450 family protein n=1 Tax=Cerasicoccus frondis TaxID=490090 RepID=UPI002852717C|nr:DUF3450 family protein [Cerasicoccus frondis]
MLSLIRSHAIGGLILFGASLTTAQSEQPSAHAALLEWVRTEKLISEEAADWQADQAVLADMITVLEMESAQIEKQMAAVESTIANSTAKTAALAEREAKIHTEIQELAGQLPAWESTAMDSVEAWPAPLRNELTAFSTLQRKAESELDWVNRAASWIQVLQQADQFNRQVTLHVDVYSPTEGQEWEVHDIYFGLAGGYWATADGGKGGVLKPSPEGWVRETDAAAAALAEDMIAVAESRRPSVHLDGPVKVD